MPILSEEVNVEYITSVLDGNSAIEDILKLLEAKGAELGRKIKSMEELEGECIEEGDLRILKECPMAGTISRIKEMNNGTLPPYFDDIVRAFRAKYPNRGAVLHPLCIVHQVIRTTFGMEHGQYYEEVACRGADGTIVVSQDGLVMSGLSEGDARSKVSDAACLYYIG